MAQCGIVDLVRAGDRTSLVDGSLGAIGYTVHRAAHAHGATKILLIALAISVVALSWLTVHTLYLVRYGDVYYDEPDGGMVTLEVPVYVFPL